MHPTLGVPLGRRQAHEEVRRDLARCAHHRVAIQQVAAAPLGVVPRRDLYVGMPELRRQVAELHARRHQLARDRVAQVLGRHRSIAARRTTCAHTRRRQRFNSGSVASCGKIRSSSEFPFRMRYTLNNASRSLRDMATRRSRPDFGKPSSPIVGTLRSISRCLRSSSSPSPQGHTAPAQRTRLAESQSRVEQTEHERERLRVQVARRVDECCDVFGALDRPDFSAARCLSPSTFRASVPPQCLSERGHRSSIRARIADASTNLPPLPGRPPIRPVLQLSAGSPRQLPKPSPRPSRQRPGSSRKMAA